jgi:hypothetical protein
VKSGTSPNTTRCVAAFEAAFAATEQNAGPGVCSTEGDINAIEALVDACRDDVAAALSVWELRYARIPVVRPLRQGISVPSLSEAYHLIVPKPSPSLGDRSPGRPDVRLDFHPSAASWLQNLLGRYENQRRQIVQNPANEYLFVSSRSARYDVPVCHVFLWKVIRRASLRVLGGACSPNILRKTVGIMFADRAGAGILHWMGWDDQQAFAYTWAERQMVRPRQELSSNLPGSDPSAEPVVFPSPLNHAF